MSDSTWKMNARNTSGQWNWYREDRDTFSVNGSGSIGYQSQRKLEIGKWKLVNGNQKIVNGRISEEELINAKIHMQQPEGIQSTTIHFGKNAIQCNPIRTNFRVYQFHCADVYARVLRQTLPLPGHHPSCEFSRVVYRKLSLVMEWSRQYEQFVMAVWTVRSRSGACVSCPVCAYATEKIRYRRRFRSKCVWN